MVSFSWSVAWDGELAMVVLLLYVGLSMCSALIMHLNCTITLMC